LARAVRFITWLLNEAGDVMCLRRFYEVAEKPTSERKVALYKCVLSEGLPTVEP
jgi:hypothetical protein